MKKKLVLYFGIPFLALIFFVQTILIRHVWITEKIRVTDKDTSVTIMKDIEALLSVTDSLNAGLILVHPHLLIQCQKSLQKSLKPPKNSLGPCIYSFGKNEIVPFMVMHQSLQYKERILTELLQERGFSFWPIEGACPQPHSKCSLFYVLQRNGVPIQLIFLYETKANFWWHGSFDPLALPKLSSKFLTKSYPTTQDLNLYYGRHEGAYNKFRSHSSPVNGLGLLVPVDVADFLSQHRTSTFKSCNESRVAQFRSLYLPSKSTSARLFRHKAWKTLSKAVAILDKLKIPFWLSSGTCLGYFRECDIIAHAKDVDLGIKIQDYDEAIIKEFTKRNMPLKHWFGKVEDSLELSFQDGTIKLDIFFFYDEADHVWNGGTQVKTGKKFKYIFPAFDLCWTEFLSLKVRVPCDTLTYIEANYGPDWDTPVTEWDWKTSPFNVQANGKWSEEELAEVIKIYF